METAGIAGHADADFQKAVRAGKLAAEIQSHGKDAGADRDVAESLRRAQLRAAAGRVVEAELKVEVATGGRAAVFELALIGKGCTLRRDTAANSQGS